VGILLLGTLLLWLVTLGVACLLWPDEQLALLQLSSTALGLCLVPTVLTMLWASWSSGQDPEQQVVAALGGTGVRMFFVLGVGLLLSSSVPYYQEHFRDFWIWVLLFYLATLALEMTLLVRARTQDLARPTEKQITSS
jgi:hypothetical protein